MTGILASSRADSSGIPSGSEVPSTPNWNALLSHSKPAPPISTEAPPVFTESRSRSRTREPSPESGVRATSELVMLDLPPVPAYAPPLPPVPTKPKLQADAQPFVPMPRRPSNTIVIKNTHGEEVNVRSLHLNTSAASLFALPASNTIRIESEEDRRRRLAAASTEHASAVKDDPVEVDSPTEEVESPTHTDFLAGSTSSLAAPEDHGLAGTQSSYTTDMTMPQSLEIPVLETSPPTGPLDGQFPTSAPPIRMRRERSRRSSRRADASAPPTVNGPPVADLANAAASGLIAMTRTRSGNLTRTRSGEPRRRAPARLDLSGIPRPSGVNTGALASAISNARMITDIYAVEYPEADGIVRPLKELNEGISDGKFL